MEGRSVSIVTQISEFNESIHKATKSVIAFSKTGLVADWHIVTPFGYDTSVINDKETLVELDKLGLVPVWHSVRLNETKLKAKAIVYLEPDLSVTDGALTQLVDHMVYTGADHGAVSSILIIKSNLTFQALSYGFLLVILMLDTLRSIVCLFQYNRTTDLRMRLVTSTWNNRIRLAPYRWFFWWIGTGMTHTIRGGSSCKQVPDKRDQGVAFVLRTIKTHNHMNIGLYWILGYLLYYFIFAFPLWNYIIPRTFYLAPYLLRNPFAWYWISTHLLHMAVVGYLSWLYIDCPLITLHVLLYPVYLTLSPVLFLYGRFHHSRAGWKKSKKIE